MLNDTIAAISTALSPSGIGIIRISGEYALDVLKKVFKTPRTIDYTKLESHKIHYGYIIDPVHNRKLDEVLVSIMLAPNTYTKEDVVEINTHGGMIVMQSVLGLVLRSGARIAEPGEFTKRAFLNGRLDLSQAEAVMDLIEAKTELGLDQSVNQLQGGVKKEIESMKEEVLQLLADIEVSIDYPEYDVEDVAGIRVKTQTKKLCQRLQELISSFDNGKIIREGIKTVIVGRPNVGKSSLLNALLKEQRAIVTNIPGTTRDSLEEYMNVHGIPLKLIDTAGIRITEDIVERIGVDKSKQLIQEADLVLLVMDASEPLTVEDQQIIDMLQEHKVIILLNKSDLKNAIESKSLQKMLPKATIIQTSAVEYLGLDKLEEEIKRRFVEGQLSSDGQTMISNLRHKHALEEALDSFKKVIESVDMNMPEDCWTIDLNDGFEKLSEVTGDHVTDDVIQRIFSQFCLGK